MIIKGLKMLVTVALSLAASLAVVLWWDSYRFHSLPPDEQEEVDRGIALYIPQAGLSRMFWYDHNRQIISLRTSYGICILKHNAEITASTPATRRTHAWVGFAYKRWRWTVGTGIQPDYRVREIHVPLWFVLLLLAAYPMMVLVYHSLRRSRRKRRKIGLCLECGYDLRGSKERCPKCGTEFAKQE